MGCPNIGVFQQDFTFNTQFTNNSGIPTDLDALPTYKIYEETTNTEIASGTMGKQDDTDTDGFYVKLITLSDTNGFETLKTYTIRVEGVASGVDVVAIFPFICMGQSDLTISSGDLLTTVERFKLYMGITTSDDDTLLGQLITRSTNAIQVFCNRDFVVKTYREFYDGEGQSELSLHQYPLVSVTMLGVGDQDAFGIQNTSSDAYNAQVSFDEATMTLQVSGGTNSGIESLTLANYDTLPDLFAAITSLSKGWTTTELTTLEFWSPIELLPTGKGLQCLGDIAYPQIPEEPASDFTTDTKAGILKYFGRFCNGFQNVVVRYSAGYAEIPADLEQICIDLTKTYYDSMGGNINSNMKKEKIGDYEYETGGTAQIAVTSTTGIPSMIAGRLKLWSAWA